MPQLFALNKAQSGTVNLYLIPVCSRITHLGLDPTVLSPPVIELQTSGSGSQAADPHLGVELQGFGSVRSLQITSVRRCRLPSSNPCSDRQAR